MTTETIVLDPNQLQSTSTTSVTSSSGVPVRLSLSTLDVPRSLTITKEQGDFLRITFKYVDDEQATEHRVDESLTTFVGKNSGKVLGILLALSFANVQQVLQRLRKELDRELEGATKDNQRLNYKLIKNLLTEEPQITEEIARSLVTAGSSNPITEKGKPEQSG